MRVLENLEPKRVFEFFEDICAIPHGSGNTKQISDYCADFAKSQGLWYQQDELNNIVIKKPASAGYEEHPPVILQGHLDMVCEKDADCDLDFLHDGLRLCTDGGWVFAKGTTLGGDDGIAVAMVLAILESDLPHPPIEAVFTTDEETGMYGAQGLCTNVLSGRMLINIDSEEEGVLTAGCAGGARAEIEISLNFEPLGKQCVRVTFSGLAGGHSGTEINKGRLNANTLMGEFLSGLEGYRIAEIAGGLKDNAIPQRCSCVLCCEQDIKTAAECFARTHRAAEPNITAAVEPAGRYAVAMDQESSYRVSEFLCSVPNGVISMCDDIEGLVQTSLNLGILKTENNRLSASFAVRSSKNSEKTALLEALNKVSGEFGGEYSSHGYYPAWEYRPQSRLRDTMVKVYRKLYCKEPEVSVIHAGLECGLFCEKLEGLDAISLGPDMQDIHTSRERLSVESTARTYRYICEILKQL